jgi:hypothetical protein
MFLRLLVPCPIIGCCVEKSYIIIPVNEFHHIRDKE